MLYHGYTITLAKQLALMIFPICVEILAAAALRIYTANLAV
jgi:hypothetical protein